MGLDTRTPDTRKELHPVRCRFIPLDTMGKGIHPHVELRPLLVELRVRICDPAGPPQRLGHRCHTAHCVGGGAEGRLPAARKNDAKTGSLDGFPTGQSRCVSASQLKRACAQ